MEEKIKMISLSANQWHFKLIKFVFGSAVGNLSNIRNLCPYFWLLIAAMIVVIPVLPFKLLGMFFKVVGKLSDKFQESKMHKWLSSLTPFEAYDLYDTYGAYGGVIKKPKYASKNYWDTDLLDEWAKSKGLTPGADDYQEKLKKIFAEIRKERKKLYEQNLKLNEKRQKAAQEAQRKRKLRDEKIHNTMNAFGNMLKPVAKVGNSIRESLRFDNYSKIVMATKKFVGVIITLFIAAFLVLVGQLITWGVLELLVIWSWPAIWASTVTVLEVLGILGVLIGIGYLIWLLINKAVEYYEQNYSYAWYSIPFVYLALGIFYLCKYAIYYPMYFIFVAFLWKLVCVSIVWGAIKGFGHAILKFTGIFGEYFGASYTDFCPGVKWEEEKK